MFLTGCFEAHCFRISMVLSVDASSTKMNSVSSNVCLNRLSAHLTTKSCTLYNGIMTETLDLIMGFLRAFEITYGCA